jgi:hypothetical protein
MRMKETLVPGAYWSRSAANRFYSSARTTKPATSGSTDYFCGGSTGSQNYQGSSRLLSIWTTDQNAMGGAANFFGA